jgi:hypothetical protein
VKYFFLKGQGSQLIHNRLVNTFENNAFADQQGKIGSGDSQMATLPVMRKNDPDDFRYHWDEPFSASSTNFV